MRLDRTGLARSTLATLTTAVALMTVGCGDQSSNQISPNGVGSAELNLALPDNTTIATVSYTVTRSGGFSRSDMVPVGDSQAITFQVGNLPSNTGYQMSLSAMTSDNQMCNAGPVGFDITAHNTALIMMTLRCGGGAAATNSGNVRVDVDVQKDASCAQVDGVTALPRSVKVGSTIQLRGFATTSTATYAWSVVPATGGSFATANAQNSVFTCNAAGTHTVTLTVNGGGSCTSDTETIPLICTGPGGTAGTVAAGSGGAGGTTGGTGGTTGGTGGTAAGTGGTTGGTGGTAAGTGGTTGGTGGTTGGTGGTAAGTGGTTGGTGGTTGGTGGTTGGTGGTVAGGTGGTTGGTGGTTGGGTGLNPSAACVACRNTNCRDFQGTDLVRGCFEMLDTSQGAMEGDATFLTECIALVNCAYREKCAYGSQGLGDCYCGTNTIDACIMNGPAADAKCPMEVQTAARTSTPSAISERLSNPAFPTGFAYYLLQCDKESCAADCVPQ